MIPALVVTMSIAQVSTEALSQVKRQESGYRLVIRKPRDLWRQTPSSRPLQIGIQQRIEWAAEDELDETGEAVVTDMAANALLALFAGLDQWYPRPGRPLPHISLYMEGGLMAEWRGNGKDLVILVSPTGQTRLHRVYVPSNAPISQDVFHSPGVRSLRDALDWLQS